MNEKNQLIKILIPVIAVVIIFESVLLVSRLSNNSKTAVVADIVKTEEATNSSEIKKVVDPILALVFATDSKEMKVGKAYKVELNMVSKEDKTIDALDTYIKYDPMAVTVSGLTFNSKLPKPVLSKINTQKSMIESSILVDTKPGYSIKNGQAVQILSFTVTPKKVGVSNLEISTGNDNKNSATIIVESVTSKEIPLSVNKLEINAIK